MNEKLRDIIDCPVRGGDCLVSDCVMRVKSCKKRVRQGLPPTLDGCLTCDPMSLPSACVRAFSSQSRENLENLQRPPDFSGVTNIWKVSRLRKGLTVHGLCAEIRKRGVKISGKRIARLERGEDVLFWELEKALKNIFKK